MNALDRIDQAELSPLARHFSRFCAELDPAAPDEALITAAVLADRNTQGHTCLDLAALAQQPLLWRCDESGARHILHQAPSLNGWMDALPCGFIGNPEQDRPLILDGARLYLRRHWKEEQDIATALRARCQPVAYDESTLRQRMQEWFPNAETDPGAAGQHLAAAIALTGRLAVITGGPGTGKTTTVTKILALLLEQEPSMRILLAAPTGKAAARLVESIQEQIVHHTEALSAAIRERFPRQAATLHRLLGWRPNGFTFHAGNPLPCDCLLIDETSMVDQGLMAAALNALPEHARLILLGDRNQLASVEAGAVLGDITGHGRPLSLSPERATSLQRLTGLQPKRPTNKDAPILAGYIAELSHSYRFAAGGGIGRLAAAVNRGDSQAVLALMDNPDAELTWHEASGEQPSDAILTPALSACRRVLDAQSPQEALEAFTAFRLLTALADGPWGASGLQHRLESLLRNEGRIRTPEGQEYPGQPILIRRNDRETGLYNGDTGILWPQEWNAQKKEEGKSRDKPRLMAWFQVDGELRSYPLPQLPDWQSAWTLTVHRSQGSQYRDVLLVLPPRETPVVTRELIYTGITRAEKHCTLITQPESLLTAIRHPTQRHSGLAERLQWNDQ